MSINATNRDVLFFLRTMFYKYSMSHVKSNKNFVSKILRKCFLHNVYVQVSVQYRSIHQKESLFKVSRLVTNSVVLDLRLIPVTLYLNTTQRQLHWVCFFFFYLKKQQMINTNFQLTLKTKTSELKCIVIVIQNTQRRSGTRLELCIRRFFIFLVHIVLYIELFL